MSSLPPHSAPQGSDGGSTAARLLRAAAELLGSEPALAARLGIGPAMLARLMSGQKELPAELVLRTVDILLEVKESHDPLAAAVGAGSIGGADA